MSHKVQRNQIGRGWRGKESQLKEKYRCNSMIVESAQDLTSLVRL